ncbi:MAG: GGDEF domain-containing protein [Ruminococcus sp.]|nr:GGDEF domain-containing protein [Ruminococcus sp.]
MSPGAKNKLRSLHGIKKIQALMIIGYAIIVIVAVALVSVLAIRKTDEVLKKKVISLTSSLNVQMKLNMESYLSRMETIATLAFGEESSYTYDATDPLNDEYEAINTEKVITDRLFSLCIMENFVDYGIVYRNNRTVGKISNGTLTLFGDNIYKELSAMISRERTNDGWQAGYNGDLRRIYYVKKVHDNAVLVISFYSAELDSVFDNPETLGDMEIRLVDQNYNTIYSKSGEDTGKPLSEKIVKLIEGKTSASVMDDELLVTVDSCDNWYVVCYIPTRIILNEKNDMKLFIFMTAGLAALLALLVGFLFSYKLTSPIKKTVVSLDEKASEDLLTGTLNKLSFEEYASNILTASLEDERHALLILDIDNFKGVNDSLGHAFGDKVLKKTGDILRATFSEDDYLGRIGGDEFCVLVNTRFDTEEKFREYVETKCGELCTAYRNNYTGKNGEYKISASIGVAVSPDDAKTFEQLYHACDKALYRSKKSGKDTYTFYDPSMESEGEA